MAGKQQTAEVQLIKVSVQELIDKMDFTDENTAGALLTNAGLLLKASYYRVQKMRLRMRAESNLEAVTAETALAIRAQEAGNKVTEGYIKETVATDKRVRAAQTAFDEAKAVEEWAKLMLNCYEMRGSMAKALVQLLGAEAAAESGFVRAEMERMGVGKLRERILRNAPSLGGPDEE